MFVAEIDGDKSLNFDLKTGRQGYLICIEGACTVNSVELARHEACEIASNRSGDSVVVVQGKVGDERTHCMLFEMAKV